MIRAYPSASVYFVVGAVRPVCTALCHYPLQLETGLIGDHRSGISEFPCQRAKFDRYEGGKRLHGARSVNRSIRSGGARARQACTGRRDAADAGKSSEKALLDGILLRGGSATILHLGLV
jgi:hypothetical protein